MYVKKGRIAVDDMIAFALVTYSEWLEWKLRQMQPFRRMARFPPIPIVQRELGNSYSVFRLADFRKTQLVLLNHGGLFFLGIESV